MAAPKACLQAPLVFPLPNALLGSLCLPIFFLFDPTFCLFPPVEPGPRLLIRWFLPFPWQPIYNWAYIRILALSLGHKSFLGDHTFFTSFPLFTTVQPVDDCWHHTCGVAGGTLKGHFLWLRLRINCLHCYFAFLAGVGSHNGHSLKAFQPTCYLSWRLFKEYQPL